VILGKLQGVNHLRRIILRGIVLRKSGRQRRRRRPRIGQHGPNVAEAKWSSDDEGRKGPVFGREPAKLLGQSTFSVKGTGGLKGVRKNQGADESGSVNIWRIT